MRPSYSLKCLYSLFLISIAIAPLFGQSTDANQRIKWKLTVVLLDGADRVQHAEIPVKEAVEFIRANSRIDIETEFIESPSKHDYTVYVTPANKKTGTKRENRYLMLSGDLPVRLVKSLPKSTSYIFLYKLFGRIPAQAGSSLGLDFGIPVGGKPRPWATVPVDPWWYVNTPKQGFKSWAAQIVAHEMINTIQAIVEARPFKCGKLNGTPNLLGDKWEASRLGVLTEKCYKKLAKISDL